MVVVVMGAVFLATDKDILVLVSLFIFVVLGWIGAFGLTSYSSHVFSFRFPQMLLPE